MASDGAAAASAPGSLDGVTDGTTFPPSTPTVKKAPPAGAVLVNRSPTAPMAGGNSSLLERAQKRSRRRRRPRGSVAQTTGDVTCWEAAYYRLKTFWPVAKRWPLILIIPIGILLAVLLGGSFGVAKGRDLAIDQEKETAHTTAILSGSSFRQHIEEAMLPAFTLAVFARRHLDFESLVGTNPATTLNLNDTLFNKVARDILEKLAAIDSSSRASVVNFQLIPNAVTSAIYPMSKVRSGDSVVLLLTAFRFFVLL